MLVAVTMNVPLVQVKLLRVVSQNPDTYSCLREHSLKQEASMTDDNRYRQDMLHRDGRDLGEITSTASEQMFVRSSAGQFTLKKKQQTNIRNRTIYVRIINIITIISLYSTTKTGTLF